MFDIFYTDGMDNIEKFLSAWSYINTDESTSL
jgi:hypothetical protein